MKLIPNLLFFTLLYLTPFTVKSKESEDKEVPVEEELYGVKYPNSCEVCKYLVVELENRLKETGKSHDVIEIGYELDDSARKKTKYKTSELRLLDSLDGICDKLLDYNIHKEREDSTRFAKGMSTTFKVLHDLVDKGVKVDLGIPLDLWDKPSAEVSQLKTQCESLIEKHEGDIENWYFHHQDVPLRQYLCIDRALRKGDDACLDEVFVPKKEDKDTDKKTKTERKEDKTKDKKKKKKKLKGNSEEEHEVKIKNDEL
ncbi:protein canopy 4-like [Limulus polyphemus]|uniref:Protein canopy 4-like n=1 Tax=Limulus polyphemus TaxID=6850 RepID=A0ABM1BBD0_LIMPO|nr:protein canopy 4-like [Limulus polyphemus]XP_013778580.1 protein canopy 4-like [Limulus polyphemus]XP_013778581.1 protein canopy 4-like [Limulus polyphemus]XP_013778582.1 protein canopy 4-like [Limulus polyphemus]XP_022246272.1 protein canopy 4-like [Limulus polyphemus]